MFHKIYKLMRIGYILTGLMRMHKNTDIDIFYAFWVADPVANGERIRIGDVFFAVNLTTVIANNADSNLADYYAFN